MDVHNDDVRDDVQSYTTADEEVDTDYASMPQEADELDEDEDDALSELGDMPVEDLSTADIDDQQARIERQQEEDAENGE